MHKFHSPFSILHSPFSILHSPFSFLLSPFSFLLSQLVLLAHPLIRSQIVSRYYLVIMLITKRFYLS
jgi:hypothetical protein